VRNVAAGENHEIEEIGIRTPDMIRVAQTRPGEVGFIVAGIKDVGGARSGETITETLVPRQP